MHSFSIADLEQYSGVKAHTIRIWEQRYQALEPDRSPGGVRIYNDLQLKRLLNIVNLLQAGYKIAEVGSLEDKTLTKLITKSINLKPGSSLEFDNYINRLLTAGKTFDIKQLDLCFNELVQHHSFDTIYRKILLPLLQKVGILWTIDNLPTAGEHFISNFIKQKIHLAIQQLPSSPLKKEKWVLFLPENEWHEIPLLFASYLIQKSNRSVYYLGANLPISALTEVVKVIRPVKFCFFMTLKQSTESIQHYLEQLNNEIKSGVFYFSAKTNDGKTFEIPSRMHVLNAIDDLENCLN